MLFHHHKYKFPAQKAVGRIETLSSIIKTNAQNKIRKMLSNFHHHGTMWCSSLSKQGNFHCDWILENFSSQVPKFRTTSEGGKEESFIQRITCLLIW